MPVRIGVAIVALLAVVAAGVLLLTYASAAREDAEPAAVPAAPERAAGTTSRAATAPISPRPFADVAQRAGATAVAASLEVELIGPSGAPAPGARLVLARDGKVAGTARTDARGLAAFPPAEGIGTLYVVPESAPKHKTTIALDPGRRRVELPAGVSISGRAEVDGAPPPEPKVFSFRRQVSEDWPWAIWGTLRRAGDDASAVAVDGSGGFEIAGLREGEECRFGGSGPYELIDVSRAGTPAIVVTAPATDVVVRLHRAVRVKGRVVSAGARAPVPSASCVVKMEADGLTSAMNMPADERGEFSFVIPSRGLGPGGEGGAVRRIEVEVAAPNGHGTRSVALEPLPDRDHDLGDLELAAGRRIEFVARDEAGAPVGGAFARAPDDRDASVRTDASGRAAIDLPPEASSFVVGALAHDVVEVPAPPGVALPVPVTLRAGCVLEVKLQAPSGVRKDSLGVRLFARVRKVYGGSFLGTDPVHVAAGATPGGYSQWSEDSATLNFKPRDGVVVVPGLLPGVPLEIAALDVLGNVLATTVATLHGGERKTVVLVVEARARTLQGVVRDQHGSAVSEAMVVINSNREDVGARNWSFGGTQRITTKTDAGGRFSLGGVLPERVHFAVDKRGYVPLIVRDHPLPADDAPIELTLQKGAALTLIVTDAAGAPLRRLETRAELDGFPRVHPEEKQPGAYAFDDLPLGVPVTAIVAYAGRDWTRRVVLDGPRTETIAMPATGVVRIAYAAVAPPFLLKLAPAGPEGGAVEDWVHPKAPELPLVHEFPVVLPGTYAVELQKDARPAALPESVTVRAGATATVTLRSP
jgi:hypothetical protein